MRVPKVSASEFTTRLGELLAEEEIDPDVHMVQGVASSINADGRGQYIETGAEAVLIIRGPEEAREAVLKQLLASLS